MHAGNHGASELALFMVRAGWVWHICNPYALALPFLVLLCAPLNRVENQDAVVATASPGVGCQGPLGARLQYCPRSPCTCARCHVVVVGIKSHI